MILIKYIVCGFFIAVLLGIRSTKKAINGSMLTFMINGVVFGLLSGAFSGSFISILIYIIIKQKCTLKYIK